MNRSIEQMLLDNVAGSLQSILRIDPLLDLVIVLSGRAELPDLSKSAFRRIELGHKIRLNKIPANKTPLAGHAEQVDEAVLTSDYWKTIKLDNAALADIFNNGSRVSFLRRSFSLTRPFGMASMEAQLAYSLHHEVTTKYKPDYKTAASKFLYAMSISYHHQYEELVTRQHIAARLRLELDDLNPEQVDGYNAEHCVKLANVIEYLALISEDILTEEFLGHAYKMDIGRGFFDFIFNQQFNYQRGLSFARSALDAADRGKINQLTVNQMNVNWSDFLDQYRKFLDSLVDAYGTSLCWMQEQRTYKKPSKQYAMLHTFIADCLLTHSGIHAEEIRTLRNGVFKGDGSKLPNLEEARTLVAKLNLELNLTTNMQSPKIVKLMKQINKHLG